MPVDRMFHPCVGDSEKVAQLVDGEFRIWFAYVMAADDFGVLPLLASKLQGTHAALAARSSKAIERTLRRMVGVGLLAEFAHGQSAFLWTPTWQFFQKIRWPRRQETHYPPPPEDELRALTTRRTAPTRDLVATFHTKVSDAFRREFGDPETLVKLAEVDRKRFEKSPDRSGNDPAIERERSGDISHHASARARASRETPNTKGLRPKTSSEGGAGETAPLDQWWLELLACYPTHRVQRNHRVETLFLKQFVDDSRPRAEVWADMREGLESQVAGYEWRVKGMVPALDKWLEEGRWRQRHERAPASVLVSEKTAHTLESAAAFIKAGER